MWWSDIQSLHKIVNINLKRMICAETAVKSNKMRGEECLEERKSNVYRKAGESKLLRLSENTG